MTTKWQILETDADLSLMAKVLNIKEATACVMAHRGIRSKNAALSFLAPSIERLRDPLQMKDMQKAVEIIHKTCKNGRKITIYGDYDADGIMSTVILYKSLKRLGADCDYYIPHRIEEGYGLNQNAVEKILERGTELIITVDNGIASAEEIKTAAEHGVSTIVIDHHEPQEILPSAAAIVDPKQVDCTYPFDEMCAAGIVYLFATALADYAKIPLMDEEHDEILMLAAIATLCDIVPLTDENRIIVNSGLAVLNANKLINPGLGSLITMRDHLDKPIESFTVGYIIGPCLNATGRLESAEIAVELLLATSDDTQKRLELAQTLIELNDARKTLTSDCVDRLAADLPIPLPNVLVLTDFEAHESVAGIVAGRIRESTQRPTILLTRGDGATKGSGRSVEGYNLFEALYAQRHLFTRFGGHAMAAGLTLPEENISLLRDALNADCALTEDDFIPTLSIDRILRAEEITLTLSDELSRLAPFGKGNNEPLFVCYGLLAEKVRILNEKNTLIFSFFTNTGKRLKGIAFGLNKNYATTFGIKSENVEMDVAFTVESNTWNNITEVQLRIRDFKVV
ncbi:MAG: single-stranded-DNA-specific exonuclease RecJ [Defluviitaleaceae bacterium]|nr:single-stranded-DNA-specific exonuclease RecJ [Defluviitaleaceae bacterium]